METLEKTTAEVLNPTKHQSILTTEALTFLSALHHQFNSKRIELLKNRATQQELFDQGDLPKFPKETESIRNSVWTAAPIPEKLLDRRVEITGPVDRKMVINALNSGAKIFMADFEDSCSPTFENLIEGQQNLFDTIRKTITLELNNKTYKLNNEVATLLVRPRGLHLEEKNITINKVNFFIYLNF
jgi:malate synthase